MSGVPSPPPVPPPSAVEAFLKALESRTEDPMHLRLIQAARSANPAASLEKELARVIEELLHAP